MTIFLYPGADKSPPGLSVLSLPTAVGSFGREGCLPYSASLSRGVLAAGSLSLVLQKLFGQRSALLQEDLLCKKV